jgi:hypothetical protein
MLWWFIYDDCLRSMIELIKWCYVCIYVCMFVCMYVSMELFENLYMNAIVKLFECFDFPIIGEYSWKYCDLLSWTCIGELYVFE